MNTIYTGIVRKTMNMISKCELTVAAVLHYPPCLTRDRL